MWGDSTLEQTAVCKMWATAQRRVQSSDGDSAETAWKSWELSKGMREGQEPDTVEEGGWKKKEEGWAQQKCDNYKERGGLMGQKKPAR